MLSRSILIDGLPAGFWEVDPRSAAPCGTLDTMDDVQGRADRIATLAGKKPAAAGSTASASARAKPAAKPAAKRT